MAKQEATTPFAIRFTNGYHSVKQCFDVKHAAERAKEEHPGMVVDKITDLDANPVGWYHE